MENEIKHNPKIGLIIFLFSLVILVLPATANAFANTFLENKTMELYKGEVGEYCIYLQNIGEEDLIQVIKIFEGEEYIKNLGEITNEFNVPVGTVSDDLPICMEVELPRDSEKGIKYAISYGIAGASSKDTEGMVSFDPVQITEGFYLTEGLGKKANDEPTIIIYVIFGLAIAAILTTVYYKGIKK